MKIPALWMATALAAGIALSLRAVLPVSICVVAAALCIGLASLALWQRRAETAWVLALLAWAAVGLTATSMQRASVKANGVGTLIAQGRLDTSVPLRWQGRLRADPADRPWGREYLIDLEQVEQAGATTSVRGGLRVTLYEDRADSHGAVGDLSAGDRVEALVKAQPPHNFNDPGAFDEKSYLAAQNIDLTGSLRSGELLTLVDRSAPGIRQRLAHMRGVLLARLDRLFAGNSESAAVLRAMLLGDRSFVNTTTVVAFQKTAAYHVLVVAGLHTGALAIFLLWLCRRLRFGIAPTILLTLGAIAAYVGVVEDRPPIFRAALIAAIYLLARPLFRRVDLLNTVALAALGMLLWNPAYIADSSFQLSFLAAGVIAALALPWIERTTAPYRAGLAHLGDVTRDVVHPPKIAQFRIEARSVARWFSPRFPHWLALRSTPLISGPVRLGLRLCELLLLSAALQLGMLPLMAQDFHRISLSGPLSNIPAVVLTSLIVPLGFLCLAGSFLWTRGAFYLSKVLSALTAILLGTIDWFSRLPHLSYRIPGPPVWLIVAFFSALIACAALGRGVVAARRSRTARRRLPPPIAWREWVAGLAVAALAVLIAWYPFAPHLAYGQTQVNVLDVGQGDSIFVSFPNGQTMLVDGGGLAGSEWSKGMRSAPDVGEEVVSPYLWSRGIKHLDVVALTHAHEDHLGGLPSVLENFRVDELWVGRDEDTPEFAALLEKARQRGVRIVHKAVGDELKWGGVRGQVLWPPVEDAAKEASNDDSLVMRIESGATSFLLTGDIEQPEEKKILAEGDPLASDFIKVPHHGSKTSSTEPFLAAVQPSIAVVSVGEGNAYGHPSPSVVERYEQDGVSLLRTDRNGAVTVSSDGRTVSVEAFVDTLNTSALADASKRR